jgi:hypothetical protein
MRIQKTSTSRLPMGYEMLSGTERGGCDEWLLAKIGHVSSLSSILQVVVATVEP